MKLSIITVNYNDAEGLERTIKSVMSQSFKDFEFISLTGDLQMEVWMSLRNMKIRLIIGFLSGMVEFIQE